MFFIYNFTNSMRLAPFMVRLNLHSAARMEANICNQIVHSKMNFMSVV